MPFPFPPAIWLVNARPLRAGASRHFKPGRGWADIERRVSAAHPLAVILAFEPGLFHKITLERPPLLQLRLGLLLGLPGGLHGLLLPFPAADLPLHVSLALAGLVLGQLFAVV